MMYLQLCTAKQSLTVPPAGYYTFAVLRLVSMIGLAYAGMASRAYRAACAAALLSARRWASAVAKLWRDKESHLTQ